MNKTYQEKLTELSQRDIERMAEIRKKMKDISISEYVRLMEENSLIYKRELYEIMHSEDK